MPVFLGFPCNSADKESTCNAGDLGLISGLGNPLEKGEATHSSYLAWRIPWTVQTMGLQRVRHAWGLHFHLKWGAQRCLTSEDGWWAHMTIAHSGHVLPLPSLSCDGLAFYLTKKQKLAIGKSISFLPFPSGHPCGRTAILLRVMVTGSQHWQRWFFSVNILQVWHLPPLMLLYTPKCSFPFQQLAVAGKWSGSEVPSWISLLSSVFSHSTHFGWVI